MSSSKKPNPKTTKKRVRKVPNHTTFKLTKRKLRPAKPLPGVFLLIKGPFKMIMANKRLYFGLILIQALLILVFTKGLGTAFDFADTRQEFFDLLGEEDTSIETSYFLFTFLIGGSSSSASGNFSLTQMLILLISVLATIWVTRQLFADQKPRLKQAFYQGMYPVIPFVLLVSIIALQLIPAAVGNFVFATVVQGGIAVTAIEQIVWFLLMILMVLVSIYWVLASILALNIVTLQNTGPIEAYKSARDLVIHRRLGITARLVVLGVLLVAVALIIFVPLISLIPVIVEPLFLIASSAVVIYVTVYMYNFYRSLL